jgi:hypothetical protein
MPICAHEKREWPAEETAPIRARVISIPLGRHGRSSFPGASCRGHVVCASGHGQPRARLTLAGPPMRAWCGKLGPVKVVFDAELWLWDARRTDTWVFVRLPASQSEEIRDLVGGLRRGFGSVRVRVTIGSSTWVTSIFPGQPGRLRTSGQAAGPRRGGPRRRRRGDGNCGTRRLHLEPVWIPGTAPWDACPVAVCGGQLPAMFGVAGLTASP